ncbi:hypothetical protein [Haloarcula amylovorans]|uniref:hypothetical protein n=1 Tax=Haloarcula amylovorans TaxID=2562280 RepID=UPI0010766B87|nr:hypothetical protein [Halomicroarcula amylolytica]
MEIPVSLCAVSGDGVHGELTPETATLTDNGGLLVEFSTSAFASLPSTAAASISTSEEAIRVEDGSIVLEVELTIDPSDGETTSETGADVDVAPDSRTSDPSAPSRLRQRRNPLNDPVVCGCRDESVSDELAEVRDDEVPPYEDTADLQRLYETCANFIEMSKRIGWTYFPRRSGAI